MEYIVIPIVIVLAILVTVAVVILNKYKKTEVGILSNNDLELYNKDDRDLVVSNNDLQDLIIQLESLPVESIPDRNKLVEITDSKVLAHINNLIPELAQVGNSAQNAVQAVKKSGEVLYKAIIPNGAKLANSKSMDGAVRGFYHGVKGISGHADLLAQKTANATDIISNSVSSAMNVASLIVGQYYMEQINRELKEIGDEIEKISSFQNNEYKSRVFSVVAHIKNIADFESEILENNELRLSKVSQLDNLEVECTQLLGQANLTIADFTKKDNYNYESYERDVKEAQKWYLYQKSLLEVLYTISDLRYTLCLGVFSREQCGALISTYANQVKETQMRLTDWHSKSIQRLNIDIEETRRRRDGFNGWLYSLPGLVNDDLNFISMETNTVQMIQAQSKGHFDAHKQKSSELYAENVQLIIEDNKVYYLPDVE